MDFVTKHGEEIIGTLSGFDRVYFKGILQRLNYGKGMYLYMKNSGTMLWDFEEHLTSESLIIKNHLERLAKINKAGFHYVNNTHASKSLIAKNDLENHPTKEGLISIIRTLEVSPSFSLRRNKATKEMEIVSEYRKSLHYYLYIMDDEFGWMFIHLQGRCPYMIKVYVNGREYLKKTLDRKGIKYKAHENSLTAVEDLDLAQSILDKLICKNWSRFMNVLARYVNPLADKMKTMLNGEGYRWYMYQSEFALDVLFRSEAFLDKLYPPLVRHAIMFKGGEDVYTFFGRTLNPCSQGKVKGNKKRFTQGFRVRHSIDNNSIKMYTKGSVLRIEMTINNPGAFKVYREVTRKGTLTMAWVPMGKATSNMYRYAQVAQRGNEKYLEALAVIDLPDERLMKRVEQTCERTRVQKEGCKERYYPGFNLLSKQTCLILEAITNSKFCIKSFSNKDLRAAFLKMGVFIYDDGDPKAMKKLSTKVTRLLAKLRAHKLIRKVKNTFRYSLTKLGEGICYQVLNFKRVTLVL